jgi:hypothetical protein
METDMHEACWQFVRDAIAGIGPRRRVVEFGSRDVNGSVRRLFPHAYYLGIDWSDGPGVDVVADAATWTCDRPFDTVICLETLEHAPDPQAIVRNARANLHDEDGLLILTAAGRDRKPHSAIDGCELREGEHYGNILRGPLGDWLCESFGGKFWIREVPGAPGGNIEGGTVGDIQALAWCGRGKPHAPEAWYDQTEALARVNFPR